MRIKLPLIPLTTVGEVDSGVPFILHNREDYEGTPFMKISTEGALFDHYDENHFVLVNLRSGSVREFNKDVPIQIVPGDFVTEKGEYE